MTTRRPRRKPKKTASPGHTVAGDWLIGGGEMGKLVRAMDWSKTPLGPREKWPLSLRTTVNLCLNSNFPVAIVWGPQRVQLYNDGYWPICGSKHPQSMGQDFWECWASAKPAIGHVFDQAASGEAGFVTNQRIFLDRHGYLEETFFTFSFSPVRDEQGEVGGLFHPVTELTQQTLMERRLQALRALADATANARSPDQAVAQATGVLADHTADLPFVLIYLFDSALAQARLAGITCLEAGDAAAPALIDLARSDDASWPLTRLLESHRLERVDDLDGRFGPLQCGPYPEPVKSAMMMPITLSGTERPLGALIAGVSTRRALDEAYRGFYQMLGETLSTALTNAHSYELERERAEALEELNRAKTVFFSSISHEFRTPLTLMLGPLEEVLADAGGSLPQRDREQLEIAHRNALRLRKLVNSLLDFSRSEAGRARASYVPTDLAAFTAELASMFRSALESAGLELVVDCPPLPEPVYVDRDMWEKVVLNLISNAFKFTFAGRVAVRLRWEEGAAVLTVTDTGTGVDPEHLPRLFERFYQVPNVRSRTYEGSGIGLALVHELVKLHGGNIDVESRLEQGTTFTVTLPGGTAHLPAERIGAPSTQTATATEARAFVEEALHWQPEPPEAEPAAAGDPKGPQARILLVDDNADMRHYLRGLLAPHWQVEVAADGLQALEAVRRDPPDLVLTDVMMPQLDGFGLLQALRADEQTHALPVIMLSARAGEEARVEGLDAGADDYLIKPFGARELLARVRTHLDLARLRRQVVELARHDPLTDLPNRGLSYEFAERLLAGARRSGTRVALMFIDMDRFKPINDTYGHEVGDRVLKEIARRLKATVRGEDMAGRLGGDEFLAVLPHIHDGDDAAQAARHLVESLGQPYRIDHLELHTSPSIGIALFPDDGSDIDRLLKKADAAMYQAKEGGRNSFRFYSRASNQQAWHRLQIEARLRDGLKQGELALHYQPILDTVTGEVVGAEALARWPGMGIGPREFIPVAEASGMLEPLCAWVIHEGCKQLRQWREQGLPALTLSINISPEQFRHGSLPAMLAASLADCGVEAHCLQLELSPSALLQNSEQAIAQMHTIKRMGLKIAIDGLGEDALSRNDLRRLPLDTLKLDQTFAQGLATDPASVALSDAIAKVGQDLGLQVVAEGVESAESLAALLDNGCPQVQGYYFCPPVAADVFADWYRQHQGGHELRP